MEKETQSYICPQTKMQCDDECCVSAEDCHIEQSIGVISDCEPKQEQEVCNHCGKTLREQMKGCGEITCYRQFLSKQETLEEAAKKFWDKLSFDDAFEAGAKWQQERMYSEEEVFNLCREFAIFVQRKRPSYKKQQEWFEQFKK